jgi:hypothetical protein
MSDQESINILSSLVPPKQCPASLLDAAAKTEPSASEKTTTTTTTTPQPSVNGHHAAATNGINHDDDEAANNGGFKAPSGCPFFSGAAAPLHHKSASKTGNKIFVEWQTSISIASEPIVYGDYLGLDKILNAQFPLSKKYGNMAHDEHLFIVIHQSMSF